MNLQHVFPSLECRLTGEQTVEKTAEIPLQNNVVLSVPEGPVNRRSHRPVTYDGPNRESEEMKTTSEKTLTPYATICNFG
jgi:hypothetical protein